MTTSTFSARSSARALWTSAGSASACTTSAGSGSAWPGSRPDGPSRPGVLQQDRQHQARKAGAGAEVDPGRGAVRRERQAAGRCRGRARARSPRGWRPDQVHPLVPVGEQRRERPPDRPPALGARRRSRARSAGRRRVSRLWGELLAFKQPRAAWHGRAEAVSAPGVTPSMRAAWPSVAGRAARQLLARLVGETADAGVVELGRQDQLLVAAERLDVGVLAIEIAGVEPRRSRSARAISRGQPSICGQTPRQVVEADVAIGQQLDQVAALAVGVDRASPRAPPRPESASAPAPAREPGQRSAFRREAPRRARSPTQPSVDPAPGQPLVGVVGAQASGGTPRGW